MPPKSCRGPWVDGRMLEGPGETSRLQLLGCQDSPQVCLLWTTSFSWEGGRRPGVCGK